MSQLPGRAKQSGIEQTLDVETPELVTLTYTIAGIGSRGYAALLDYFICFLLLVAVSLAAAALHMASQIVHGDRTTAWTITVFVFAQFVILWGYYVLFEALADGRTPGKRSQRLRVVRDGGYSVTFGASAIRNLVRLVDMQPVFTYAAGIGSMLLSKSGKRLGDYAAGTLVVREELVRGPAIAEVGPPVDSGSEGSLLHTALTESEYAVLDRFVQRSSDLPSDRLRALTEQLAARFSSALDQGDSTTDDLALLRALHAAERAARQRGMAAHREIGAARERHAIVAVGSPRWAAFATQLADAQRHGLKALGKDGVREFVRAYRDLTGDLARLTTAARGQDAEELFYLNRLVAAAHNLIYRRRNIPLRDIASYLFAEVPREIRRSYRPIVLAAALLFGPALIAGIGVYRAPSVAAALLPPNMLDRAEEDVARAKSNEGYIPDPQVLRPVMASSIITNNIQVTFGAFALGITAGLGTVWILMGNGISLGAVVGLYASKGIAPLLFAFVAPHGILELTAICISGGAGFLLAAALLIPGALTRRAALVANGRRAIRLIAGSSLLLVVAGTLEGFVSPIEWWPLELKLAVSGVTLVLLVEYLRLARGLVHSIPSRPFDSSEGAAGLDLQIPVHDPGGHLAG